MAIREKFISDAPDEEFGCKVNLINNNKTLYIDQFTSDVPSEGWTFERDITSLDDAFKCFLPSVDVEFTDGEGNTLNETLKFNEIRDFEANGGDGPLVKNSVYLSGIKKQLNIYESLLESIKQSSELNAYQHIESQNRFDESNDILLSICEKGLNCKSEYISFCESEVEKNQTALSRGITDALEVTKNLERAYRSLDAFFKNAGTDKVKNLRIINVQKDDISDGQSGFLADVENTLKNGYDQLSMSDSYSILCVSGYVFQDKPTLLQWAKVAHKYKVMMLTDHAEEFTFDDLNANTEDYRDSDECLMNVIMTANWIEGREAEKLSDNEKDEKAFYIYPSGALVGKLYKIGTSGKNFMIIESTKGVRLDLRPSEVAMLIKNQVISMISCDNCVIAFGNCTLYNGDNSDMREYPIVRAFDFVRKALANIVQEIAFENWDKYNSPKRLEMQIAGFLDQIKDEEKLIKDYMIKEPYFNVETRRVTCELSFEFSCSRRRYALIIEADNRDVRDSLYLADEW